MLRAYNQRPHLISALAACWHVTSQLHTSNSEARNVNNMHYRIMDDKTPKHLIASLPQAHETQKPAETIFVCVCLLTAKMENTAE